MSAAPLLALVRRLTPEADTVPDVELLDRFALHGDQAAFELLVWRHGALVWAVCRRMLGSDWHAAEDASQATFVALASHARRLRDGRALAGWLHRVAVRASLDLLSSRGTSRPLPATDQEPADPLPGPAQVAAGRELGCLLDAELNRLPDKLRVAFVLCELEGRSNAEAAAVLGCPVGTVESRLSRARQRLRGWLAARGASPAVAAVPQAVRAALVAAANSSVAPAVRALAERAVCFTLAAKCLATAAVLAGLLGTIAVVSLARAAAKPAALGPQANVTGVPVQRADAEGFPLPAGVVARLGSARLRHGGRVNDVCFSPDGKWIASAGTDLAVRVWDGKTGKQLFVVKRQNGGFDRVAFTADTRSLVAAGHDEKRSCDLHRIDTTTGLVAARFPLAISRSALAAVRLSNDGTRLAIGLADTKQLQVINTTTGRLVWSVNLGKETPGGTAFAADGKTIAVSTDAGKVRLFDAIGKPAGVLTPPPVATPLPRHLLPSLSPDGKMVVAHDDGYRTLHAWDRASGKVLWTAGTANAGAYSLTFAPDGRALVQSSDGFTASALGATDGKVGASFPGMAEATASAFSPNGKVVAFGSIDGTICLFDRTSGKSMAPSADPPHAVRRLCFSPDGKTLFGWVGKTVNGWAGDWLAWDGCVFDLQKKGVAGGKQRRVTNTNWTYAGPLSANGKWTTRSGFHLGGFPRGSFYEVREAATGQCRYSLIGDLFEGRLWSDFTPDSKAVVVGLPDGTLRAWDLAARKEMLRLPGHRAVSGYAFSADSRVLVTGPGDNAERFPVRVYDLTARKELGKFHPGLGVAAVAVSGDGRRVAAATRANTGGKPAVREMAVVWDVASGKRLAQVPQHGAGGFVALSPDGRTLAVVANGAEDVRVWEVASERERFHFRHDGTITGLVFSPDGRTLAVASKEAPVYLWDVTGDLAGPAPPWEDGTAARVWDDLGSANAKRAFVALRRLRGHPKAGVALLRTRAKPPTAPDAASLRQRFTDLDSADFRTREKATESLAGLGEAIRAALEAERTRATSAEVRTRLRRLLQRLRAMTPERLRLHRAVEAVEGMAGPQAKRLLETWASGTSGLTLTVEAKAALARRGGRPVMTRPR